MKSFVEGYLEAMVDQLRAVSPDAVDRIGRRLLETARSGGQVLVAGNGGSASTASHLACDLAKTVLGGSPELRTSRFRAISLADNVALLTAWANDVSYESVFAEQVKMLGRSGDVLCVISASGNSPNVVAAVTAARAIGLHTIAFLGCDGGLLSGAVDDCVVVPCDDYGHIESVHLVLGHLLTDWLRERLDGDGELDSRMTQGERRVETASQSSANEAEPT
jgi:D-sedoheptulose 7-phosphate isomerase